MGDCLALSRKNLNFADEKEKNITKITERQKGGETNLETNNKYIRFDWAVKRMLRDKANFAVLEGLVTVLLGEKITISELYESEYGKDCAIDKKYRIDIKAINSKGDSIFVEVRITRELYYRYRIVYNRSKAITEHIQVGQKYDKVKKVYSINILYFDLGQGSDYLYHGKTVFTGVHTGDQLKVSEKEANEIKMCAPEDVFPEYFIIRVNEFNDIATTPLEEWLDYLKNNRIKDNTSTPGLREARERLLYMMMNDADRHAYDAHIDDIMVQNDVLDTARSEGLEQGRIEGRAEGRAISIARNLKSMGFGIAEIQKATGLSEQIIVELD